MAEPERHALVVSSSRYSDPSLRELSSPTADAEALAELLRDNNVGAFRVRPVTDQPSWVVAQEIERFLSDRRLTDVTLVYFSGHGIKDEDGSLYFAAMNTEPKLLGSTAVSSAHIAAAMRKCRSRRQVLLLDCCFAGAFSKAMFSKEMLAKSGAQVGVAERFANQGAGRVVITASDAMQVALEGGKIEGTPALSVFTEVLVQGIRTGEADLDGNGCISLDELYDYVYEGVRRREPNQEPTISNADKRGDIVIALNPHAQKKTAVVADEEKKEQAEEEKAEEEEAEEEDQKEEPSPPPSGEDKAAIPAEDDREGVQLPRWLQVGLGACALVAILAIAYFASRDGASTDWSLVDVPQEVLGGPPSIEMKDIAAVGSSDAVAVGGIGTPGTKRASAWLYTGGSWSRAVESEIHGGTGEMTSVAAGDVVVVAAGWINQGDEGRNAAIWRRDDGEWSANLCRRAVCGGDGKQEILALAATSSGGFVAVGREALGREASSKGFDAVVWRSDDGSEWERVPDDGAFGGDLDQAMKGVVELDGLLVAVGRDKRAGAVWTSDDGGSTWDRTVTPFKANGRIELDAIAGREPNLLVAVGREGDPVEDDNRAAAAWFSGDRGVTWTRADVANEHFVGQQMLAVVHTPSGFVAVGIDRPGSGSSKVAAAWRSVAGDVWSDEPAISIAGADEPVMRGVALLFDGLYAVGDSKHPDEAIRDGRIWLAETEG